MDRPHEEAASNPGLTAAVDLVAECPCDEHEDAFLDALGAAGELIFAPLEPEGDDPRVLLELMTVDDGSYLLCFPDLAAAHRYDPERNYVGIVRADAFRMVAADASVDGFLVATATDEDAWALAGRSAIEARAGDSSQG